MPRFVLTDEQITALIKEPKPIPHDYKLWLRPRHIPNHRHLLTTRVVGCGAKTFALVARKNIHKPNDFSLLLRLVRSAGDLVLVRCNGWHGEHTNKLEPTSTNYKIPPNTCHVHTATERYLKIDRSLEAVGYAEPTCEYNDFESAVDFFVRNFGIVSERTGEPFLPVEFNPLLPGFAP